MIDLENLEHLQKQASEGVITPSEKMTSLIKRLVDDKLLKIHGHEDSFVYFYEDVIQDDIEVDYRAILGDDNYDDASKYSALCLKEVPIFQTLPKDMTVGTWILYALKYVDYIIVDYIQEQKGDSVDKERFKDTDAYYYGVERLRYHMLISYGANISKAGRMLDNLYGYRSRVHHNTKVDKKTKKHYFKMQNYNRISEEVKRMYPEILLILKSEYKK